MPRKQPETETTEAAQDPIAEPGEPALYLAMVWQPDRARPSKKAAAVDAKDLAEHLGGDLGEVVIVKVVGRVEAVTEYRVR